MSAKQYEDCPVCHQRTRGEPCTAPSRYGGMETRAARFFACDQCGTEFQRIGGVVRVVNAEEVEAGL